MRLFEYGARYPDIFSTRNAPVIVADTLARGATAHGDDSAVLYVACVLEYVTDLRRSMDEILRIAGEPENIYLVTVQPWTLTAALHPAARWAGIADTHAVSMGPVTNVHKGAAAGVLLALTAMSLAARKRAVPKAPAPEPVLETTLTRHKPRRGETGNVP
jgi:hypothetical protein